MSDSSSTNSSSWTLLAAEENVGEALRPVAEGVEHHADTLDPATVQTTGDMGDGTEAVSAERDSSASWQSPQELDVNRMMDVISHAQHNSDATNNPNLTPDPAHDPNLPPDPAHDPHMTSDSTVDVPSSSSTEVTSPDPAYDPRMTPDPAHDPHMIPDPAHNPHMTPDLTSVTNENLPSSLEVPAPSNPDHDTASQLEGSSEIQAPPSPDPDSFSESYTHISPSAEESSEYLLTAETLGAEKLTEEEVELRQEGEAVHHLNGEGLGQEEEESELSQRVTEDGKQAVPTVGEESGVRKRRGSLLAALERIGRQDEEEEEPEDFHLPQREEEIGFSLNKCILGAIILLGLGTIFFSEEEYDVRQMRDTELAGTQAWLNPDVPPPPVDVDNPALLSKAYEGSLHDAMLQAHLQAQKEQLKVAQGPAAEELVRREEEEDGRMKTQAESLLLKENDQMKRELASVPALQREVETLRATVTQLKHSPASEAPPPAVSPAGAPPSGQGQDGSLNTDSPAEEEGRTMREGEGKEEEKKKKKEWKVGREWNKDEPERGKQGKGWKERGEKKQKDGEKKDWKPDKDRKKEKQDDGDDGVQGWKKRKEEKGWKEETTEEWKKERESRGDDGKPWRNREDKKEGRRKDERKKSEKEDERKERKEWKKSKKEKKGGKWQEDRKEGKDEGKKKKKGEWKHEKDWGERREEEKDWKKKKDVKKDGSREWKSKEEQRPWQGREEDRVRERDRKKEREEESWRHEGGHKHKDQHKHDKHEHRHHGFTEREKGKRERLWQGPGETSPPHTHRRPPLEQPNYWLLQRERLQRNPSPQTKCTSVEACAQAEGLLPVALPEFEALLLGYLAKAEGVGVSASRREELRQLATSFFRDGVFTHDQMSFRRFVKDLADILEDMVDGEEDEEDEEDEEEEEEEGGIEDEMEGFDDEAMRKFSVPGGGVKVEKKRGEKIKEAGRAGG